MSDYRRIKRPFKRKMIKRQEIVLRKYVDNPERFTHVIGLDEVGWGAISGPLVVTAVVLPFEFENPVIKKTRTGTQYGFKDSKRFTTDKSRANGAEYAKEHVLAHETMFSMSQDVHTYGPGKALSYLQRKLIRKLKKLYPDALVVVDGNRAVSGVSRDEQVALIGADAKIPAVSAASIIAKVERDNYMITMLSVEYPYWEFHKNKGYPTPEHLEKLSEWGPTHIHRMNTEPVQKAFDRKGWYEDGAKATEGHQTRTACS
jgi:ribonuclease HII